MKCEYCGKEFSGRKKKYCSNECCKEADKLNKRIHYVGKREKICAFCGKELPKFKTRYCSRECENKSYNIKAGHISHKEVIIKNCIICGKEFETWKSRKITCSEECSRLRHYTEGDKRLKGITVDKGITLKKLAKRDDNICKLCGLPVDWSDSVKTEKAVICGKMYPSIDHIIPISLGGVHSWNNVQLAHIGCNRKKSNTFVG